MNSYRQSFVNLPKQAEAYVNKIRIELADFIRPTPPPAPKTASVKELWTITKAALLEGNDLNINKDGSPNPNKKKMLETLLDNTHYYFTKMNDANNSHASNVAILNKVIIPIIRQIMPNLIANDIICVQPMTGPVSQVRVMRKRDRGVQILEEVVEAKSRKSLQHVLHLKKHKTHWRHYQWNALLNMIRKF